MNISTPVVNPSSTFALLANQGRAAQSASNLQMPHKRRGGNEPISLGGCLATSPWRRLDMLSAPPAPFGQESLPHTHFSEPSTPSESIGPFEPTAQPCMDILDLDGQACSVGSLARMLFAGQMRPEEQARQRNIGHGWGGEETSGTVLKAGVKVSPSCILLSPTRGNEAFWHSKPTCAKANMLDSLAEGAHVPWKGGILQARK